MMNEDLYRAEYVEALALLAKASSMVRASGGLRLVEVQGAEICMAPTEDLIADRLGQWVASDRKDQEVLCQEIILFRLSEESDMSYLDKRVREDTSGELSLESFSRPCDENSDSG